MQAHLFNEKMGAKRAQIINDGCVHQEGVSSWITTPRDSTWQVDLIKGGQVNLEQFKRVLPVVFVANIRNSGYFD